MPSHEKMLTSRRLLYQLEEDRADYALGTEALQRSEATYTLDEVVRHLGMDKQHLKYSTQRQQKKHRLELDATQK